MFSHQPPDHMHRCLLHGDYRQDNIIVSRSTPSRIVGVVDWELASWGDPLYDLGYTCLFFPGEDATEDEKNMTMGFYRPGFLTREGLLKHYFAKTGFPSTHMMYYRCFGIFKAAVLTRNIYLRAKGSGEETARTQLMGMVSDYLKETAFWKRAHEYERYMGK